MRNHRRPRNSRQIHQIAQDLIVLHGWIIHRHTHHVLQRRNVILRRLHGNGVRNAVLWIQPEIRRSLEAAAQRYQHVLCHVTRVHPHLRALRTINLQIQCRQCEHLLDVYIRRTWDLSHPVCDLLCDGVIALHVGAGYLDINGRWQSKVEDLGHDICRLKEKLYSRKATGQFGPQLANVVCGRVMMLRIQPD